MGSFADDVSQADFQERVINTSRDRLVVVDFWAPWCGPCRVLKPVLEKLAEEYNGKFFLAKVNADENQKLCMEHGVRGIPSVKAFLGGEIVDEFTGAMAEGYVRDFLERNLPSPGLALLKDARTMLANDDVEGAQSAADKALALDSGLDDAKLVLAEIHLRQGDLDAAAKILDNLRGQILDYDHTQQLKARLNMARLAQGKPSVEELRQRVASGTDVLQAYIDLGAVYAAQGQYELALDSWLAVLKQQPRFQDGVARKRMLEVFDIVGPESSLVGKYRRLIANALH